MQLNSFIGDKMKEIINDKNNGKVSIIVPVYNVEKYLDECITSIINQSYKNIEIILVDDGSTDNSGKILDKFEKKDERIKVVHKENGGVSSAKNVGIELSTGEYITFVDSDDYIMDDYIEYLLNLIIINDAEISLSKAIFDNYNMNQTKKDKIDIFSSEKALVDIMTYNINVAVWDKMYKTSIIKENDIKFFENIFMGEGFNFNVCAFQKASKIAIGHRKIYFYRRDNNESATTKFKIEKWENAILAIETMKKNISNANSKVLKAWKFANWRTHVDAFTLLCITQNEKKYKEFYKKTLRVGRRYFYIPFLFRTSKKDKVRGIVMLVWPRLLSNLLILRRKMYKVNVSN